MNLPSVVVLGVRVHVLNVEELLSIACDWGNASTRKTILYVNAHCLNLAYNDPAYQETLNAADLVYPDGIGVVWGGSWLAGAKMQKITGADWIEDFCCMARDHSRKIYILAGWPGIARSAAENLMRLYPGLSIVGTADGYFLEKKESEVLEEIQRCAPHFLLAGMGSPRQELWLAEHRAELPVQVCWAVGALFDFVAGVEPRAPRWMKHLPLEWLWRFWMDPRGKWKRYLIGNPLFLLRLFRQKLGLLS